MTAPAQIAAENLMRGYHVFSVLGTDAQGTTHSSNPVMIVMHRQRYAILTETVDPHTGGSWGCTTGWRSAGRRTHAARRVATSVLAERDGTLSGPVARCKLLSE